MSEKVTVPLIGGLLAGIAASLCCVVPLLLLLLGFSGVWISNLTLFEPYRPLFIVTALGALIIAYFQIDKLVANQSCKESNICAKPATQRLYKGLFWAVVTVVIVSIVSPYLILVIYG